MVSYPETSIERHVTRIWNHRQSIDHGLVLGPLAVFGPVSRHYKDLVSSLICSIHHYDCNN